jgi:hypothetical protein
MSLPPPHKAIDIGTYIVDGVLAWADIHGMEETDTSVCANPWNVNQEKEKSLLLILVPCEFFVKKINYIFT